MTIADLAGSIEVNVSVRSGRIVSVDIDSARKFRFSQFAVGRSAESVVALVGRFFSLCAAAQCAALATAIEAARAATLDEPKRRARAAAVVAERMVELLRGTLMSLAGPSLGPFAPAMRRFVAAASRISPRSLPQVDQTTIAELECALAMLGLGVDDLADEQQFNRWLHGDTPVAALLRPMLENGDSGFGALAIDPLNGDADHKIGACLCEHGVAFSARPALAERIPETGALARTATHPLLSALAEKYGAGLLVRILARLVECCESPARLRAALVEQNDTANADVIRAHGMGPHIGLAAVECARGCLYHLVELAVDGTIRRLEILAPTEWNFHPRGPLARALNGTIVGVGAQARTRAARLVAAFDPCVAYHVSIAEIGRA